MWKVISGENLLGRMVYLKRESVVPSYKGPMAGIACDGDGCDPQAGGDKAVHVHLPIGVVEVFLRDDILHVWSEDVQPVSEDLLDDALDRLDGGNKGGALPC